MMLIKEIDFQTIEKVWKEKLWPDRQSAVEPYSAMMFMHDKYDGSFSSRPGFFLAGYVDGEIIAVNSAHLAEKYMARSRGLWVSPEHRSLGYGSCILEQTAVVCSNLGAEAVWSFSRKSSITTYEKAGYIRVSSWMDHGEFGPNAYVIRQLYK